MKKIDHLADHCAETVRMEALWDEVLTLLSREEGGLDVKQKLAEVLAFKFWHENVSNHVNAIIETRDKDYIRIHWKYFRESLNKHLENFVLSDVRDYAICAEALGNLSEWISYKIPKDKMRPALKAVFGDKSTHYVESLLSICKSPEHVSSVP